MPIGEIFNWVAANWDNMVGVYLAAVGLASIIIKITPNVRDDLWLKNWLRFVGKFIALNRK